MQATAVISQVGRNWPPRAGAVLASLLLHSTLLALLLIGQLAPALKPPAITSVSVDLISPAQFAALTTPASPPPQVDSPAMTAEPTPSATPNAPPAAPAAPANGTFRATEFYAARLLAEPASAQLRQGMRTLAASEQAVQLCDIEAMEQIRRARPDFDPDMVVPYAMGETATSDGAFIAEGGAFRSRREWYEVSFRCSPAADLSHVEAFEFTVGEEIPHELWDAHFLTAEEADE